MLANFLQNYVRFKNIRSASGIRIFVFLHFISPFDRTKYTSNIAARFHTQFTDVTARHVQQIKYCQELKLWCI